MSTPEPDSGVDGGAALKRLDRAIDRALAEVGDLRERLRTAERRSVELESLLERFDSGSERPGDYVERVKVLESENLDLRERMEQGREAVQRLLSRIRFLEEQR